MPMKEYECPICGGGPKAYLECQRPNCLDGRDHENTEEREYWDGYAKPDNSLKRIADSLGWITFWLFIIVVFLCYVTWRLS